MKIEPHKKDGNRKYWLGEADRLMSLWIRQSNSDEKGVVKCATCGTDHHWRKLDNGHFMPRQHMSTRLNEKNCLPQCTHCNHFNEGMGYQMGKALDIKWGEGTADLMVSLHKKTSKTDWFDLKIIAHEYKEKLINNKYLTR